MPQPCWPEKDPLVERVWCVTQTVPATRISVRWICPSRAVLQPSPGHVTKRTPLGSSPVTARQFFHQAVPSVMPVLESRTALACLVPLHRGRCVRPVACLFKGRLLCHDLSGWVEKLACRHCRGSLVVEVGRGKPTKTLPSFFRTCTATGLTLCRVAAAGLSHFLDKFLNTGTVIASRSCL